MKAGVRRKPKKPSKRSRSGSAAKKFALKTILVSTDFSDASLSALPYAGALAERFGARLHLVHVNDLATQQLRLAPAFDLASDHGQKLRRKLQTLGAQPGVSVDPADCHIRNGHAYEEICRQAKRLQADLIVLSTHGYSGFKHVLIGSTAERVVRSAPCPVLVVRGNKRGSLRVRKILVPTDFSPPAISALEYAIPFAETFGARLTVAHMVYPHYYATNPEMMASDFGTLLDEARAEAKREMAKLIHATSFREVPFTARTETGHPVTKIIEMSDRSRADLIIISTHGRTGLKRAFLGSVAEQVVRFAKCPVLVIPRHFGQ